MARRTATALVCVVGLAILSAGCTTQAPPTSSEPFFSKSVGNVKDAFGLSFSARNHTGVEQFTWENSKTRASVGLSQAQQGGTLSVTIQDATGREVYRSEPSPSKSSLTPTGLPGSWKITVEFKGLTGSASLGVTAAT